MCIFDVYDIFYKLKQQTRIFHTNFYRKNGSKTLPTHPQTLYNNTHSVRFNPKTEQIAN